MADYDDGQLEFAILGLVRDPSISLKQSLASNVRSIQAVLNQLGPTAAIEIAAIGSSVELEGALTGPDSGYELTQEAIDDSTPSPTSQVGSGQSTLSIAGASLRELCGEQAALRASLKEELEAARLNEEKATSRRHDYGPMIQLWLQSHARQSAIKMMVEAAGL